MAHPTSTAGRILVVDDQPANLRVVGALLSRHGFEVATAGTGDEALHSILRARARPVAAGHDDAGHGRVLPARRDQAPRRAAGHAGGVPDRGAGSRPAAARLRRRRRRLRHQAVHARGTAGAGQRAHRPEADPRPARAHRPRTPGTGQPGRARPQEPAQQRAVRQRHAAAATRASPSACRATCR